ncbi:hypothetical protein [Pseudohalioglobus lutimaris]|nr:hypothetical protein [Pseudohalioglobus lutimaris]
MRPRLLAMALLPLLVAVLPGLGWHSSAMAFRNCDPNQDSSVFRGSSRYFIGELEFNESTGQTIGTETHYNYSNLDGSGVSECHVTYDISGFYEAASALFLLDARRSSQSAGCEQAFIDANYPEFTSYTLQVSFKSGGNVEVLRADSGETVGVGTWYEGSVSYKTQETCELY